MRNAWLLGFVVAAMLIFTSDAAAQRRGGASPSPRITTPSGRTFSTGSKPAVTPTPKVNTTPSGRTFSTGGGAKPTTPPKQTSGWNPGLSSSGQKQQSKTAFGSTLTPKTKPAEAPKPTFKTGTGTNKPVKADSAPVQTVRRHVTHERYITYESRASVFYGPTIYAQPVYYNDFYSPFLMGYLFSSAVNSHERAMWLHSHRGPDLDEARYKEMLARDKELEARIRDLEKQGVKPDPDYVVSSMKDNPEFQYSKEFVTSAYNPETYFEHSDGGWGWFCFWFFIVVLALGVVGVVVYLVFIKEW
jgi:hypothetical protein